MTPLISIVIPVFNVEQYLKECIDSVLKQTYENIEILLIDDGSTDMSAKICEEYASSDQRVKCYHKTNGGLSSARNYGIERANGKYTTLVDSDDYIDERFIEVLYNNLIETDSDIAISNFQRFSEQTNPQVVSVENGNEIKIFTKLESYEALFRKEYKYQFTMACGKLYKSEILKEIPFPDGRNYEDSATAHLFISKTNRIVYSDRKQYLYRTRQTSITKSEKYVKDDIILSAKDQLGFFTNEDVPFEIVIKSAKNYITILMGVYSRIAKTDTVSEKKRKEIISQVDEALRLYPNITDGDFLFKLRILLFRKSPNTYAFVVNHI